MFNLQMDGVSEDRIRRIIIQFELTKEAIKVKPRSTKRSLLGNIPRCEEDAWQNVTNNSFGYTRVRTTNPENLAQNFEIQVILESQSHHKPWVLESY